MKSVLISIKPQYCELIASGKKTVEIRKNQPKINVPFKVYIYQSKDNWIYRILEKLNLYQQKIIGEFICDNIIDIDYGIEEGVCFDGKPQEGFATDGNGDNPTCLSFVELESYLKENEGYGWHISDLIIYDKPKELREFYRKCEVFHCEGCKHLRYQRANKAEYEYECEYFPVGHIPIERPPQSWCYVEEI